jgi:ataxia telangiectasia mutated family protein
MPQVLIYEHEGNWSKAVEGYDLLLRDKDIRRSAEMKPTASNSWSLAETESASSADQFEYNRSLIRSLQQTGCEHVLEMYCKGLSMEREALERNTEFQELQVQK